MDYTMKVIARIHSDFPEKFGIPRQSGLVPALRAKIVFEPEFRNADALRGIEGFSHLWLIWQFSAAVRENGDSVPRPAEYLSAGTLDLMYLAVRLAVCRLALPEGSSCPLVLDDALVNLDPERKKQALSLLEDISRERQVILFTCE